MDENNAMRRDKLERAHFSKKKKKNQLRLLLLTRSGLSRRSFAIYM